MQSRRVDAHLTLITSHSFCFGGGAKRAPWHMRKMWQHAELAYDYRYDALDVATRLEIERLVSAAFEALVHLPLAIGARRGWRFRGAA